MATTFDIQLPHYPRGFHLITCDILSLLPDLPENGLLVVFIKHTSAGITIRTCVMTSIRFSTNSYLTVPLISSTPLKARTI